MKIDLTGYNTDDLIRILHNKHIPIFNIEKNSHNQISFEIKDIDYKRVKRHIANFKIKQTFGKIKRFPKFLLCNIGVIIGCLIGVVIGSILSNYTWQIHIYGNKDLSKNDILLALETNNIKIGKINNSTSEEIEEILLNKYDRLAQVSVIKQGTAIIVNVSEKLVYIEQEFAPIVAKYCGIITEVNIITGTTNVKVGDYVNTGDVLVLPFNINADGEKVGVKPLAEIRAKIIKIGKSMVKKFDEVLIRTGKSIKVYNYKLKNLNLFSSKTKNSFALFETSVYNENISDVLPLNRDVLVFYELACQKIERNFDDEEQSLISKSKELAHLDLPFGKIIEEITETRVVDDVFYAITTVCVCGVISS